MRPALRAPRRWCWSGWVADTSAPSSHPPAARPPGRVQPGDRPTPPPPPPPLPQIELSRTAGSASALHERSALKTWTVGAAAFDDGYGTGERRKVGNNVGDVNSTTASSSTPTAAPASHAAAADALLERAVKDEGIAGVLLALREASYPKIGWLLGEVVKQQQQQRHHHHAPRVTIGPYAADIVHAVVERVVQSRAAMAGIYETFHIDDGKPTSTTTGGGGGNGRVPTHPQAQTSMKAGAAVGGRSGVPVPADPGAILKCNAFSDIDCRGYLAVADGLRGYYSATGVCVAGLRVALDDLYETYCGLAVRWSARADPAALCEHTASTLSRLPEGAGLRESGVTRALAALPMPSRLTPKQLQQVLPPLGVTDVLAAAGGAGAVPLSDVPGTPLPQLPVPFAVFHNSVVDIARYGAATSTALREQDVAVALDDPGDANGGKEDSQRRRAGGLRVVHDMPSDTAALALLAKVLPWYTVTLEIDSGAPTAASSASPLPGDKGTRDTLFGAGSMLPPSPSGAPAAATVPLERMRRARLFRSVEVLTRYLQATLLGCTVHAQTQGVDTSVGRWLATAVTSARLLGITPEELRCPGLHAWVLQNYVIRYSSEMTPATGGRAHASPPRSLVTPTRHQRGRRRVRFVEGAGGSGSSGVRLPPLWVWYYLVATEGVEECAGEVMRRHQVYVFPGGRQRGAVTEEDGQAGAPSPAAAVGKLSGTRQMWIEYTTQLDVVSLAWGMRWAPTMSALFARGVDHLPMVLAAADEDRIFASVGYLRWAAPKGPARRRITHAILTALLQRVAGSSVPAVWVHAARVEVVWLLDMLEPADTPVRLLTLFERWFASGVRSMDIDAILAALAFFRRAAYPAQAFESTIAGDLPCRLLREGRVKAIPRVYDALTAPARRAYVDALVAAGVAQHARQWAEVPAILDVAELLPETPAAAVLHAASGALRVLFDDDRDGGGGGCSRPRDELGDGYEEALRAIRLLRPSMSLYAPAARWLHREAHRRTLPCDMIPPALAATCGAPRLHDVFETLCAGLDPETFADFPNQARVALRAMWWAGVCLQSERGGEAELAAQRVQQQQQQEQHGPQQPQLQMAALSLPAPHLLGYPAASPVIQAKTAAIAALAERNLAWMAAGDAAMIVHALYHLGHVPSTLLEVFADEMLWRFLPELPMRWIVFACEVFLGGGGIGGGGPDTSGAYTYAAYAHLKITPPPTLFWCIAEECAHRLAAMRAAVDDAAGAGAAADAGESTNGERTGEGQVATPKTDADPGVEGTSMAQIRAAADSALIPEDVSNLDSAVDIFTYLFASQPQPSESLNQFYLSVARAVDAARIPGAKLPGVCRAVLVAQSDIGVLQAATGAAPVGVAATPGAEFASSHAAETAVFVDGVRCAVAAMCVHGGLPPTPAAHDAVGVAAILGWAHTPPALRRYILHVFGVLTPGHVAFVMRAVQEPAYHEPAVDGPTGGSPTPTTAAQRCADRLRRILRAGSYSMRRVFSAGVDGDGGGAPGGGCLELDTGQTRHVAGAVAALATAREVLWALRAWRCIRFASITDSRRAVAALAARAVALVQETAASESLSTGALSTQAACMRAAIVEGLLGVDEINAAWAAAGDLRGLPDALLFELCALADTSSAEGGNVAAVDTLNTHARATATRCAVQECLRPLAVLLRRHYPPQVDVDFAAIEAAVAPVEAPVITKDTCLAMLATLRRRLSAELPTDVAEVDRALVDVLLVALPLPAADVRGFVEAALDALGDCRSCDAADLTHLTSAAKAHGYHIPPGLAADEMQFEV